LRRSSDGSERGEERESFVVGSRVEGGSDFAEPAKNKKRMRRRVMLRTRIVRSGQQGRGRE